jgi:hypothetical protein
MKMQVVFGDGSWFIGVRTLKCRLHESWGTHHFIITHGDSFFIDWVGNEVAIPITKPKCFIMLG